jgi:outer membrane protein TolC
LRQQGNAASAKLVYLLGLPPGTCLVPAELLIVPIELVDSSPPACDLVALALAKGPGIRELEGILHVAEQAVAASHDIRNFLPAVQFNVIEGPFGAGPGGSMAWDNRLDIGLQLRWNISQIFAADHYRCLIRSRQAQAMLTYQELRGKLAAGVEEARDAICHGREQIGLSAGQVRNASESYRLNDRRLEEGVQGAREGDVLLSIRSLEQAHFNHLQAISAHNKAQVRLLLLVGPQPKPPGHPPLLPVPAEKPPALPAPKEKAGAG